MLMTMRATPEDALAWRPTSFLRKTSELSCALKCTPAANRKLMPPPLECGSMPGE